MVITPKKSKTKWNDLDDYETKGAIFLAGPCPINKYEDDWRTEAIRILEKINKDVVIINPTNPYYDESDSDELKKQTMWEYKGMMYASCIVFWIPRSEKHPAYTTNIEFGTWLDKTDSYAIGWPKDAIKMDYIRERLTIVGKDWHNDLKNTLYEAYWRAIKIDPETGYPGKIHAWFTSDTHFGQERTLKLSKRPFRNVFDMDMNLISNWNKAVKPYDIVFHAGDFGDLDRLPYYLKHLNFKELNWVLGNYDREHEEEIRVVLKKNGISNVNVFGKDSGYMTEYYWPILGLQLDHPRNLVFIITHEPILSEETRRRIADLGLSLFESHSDEVVRTMRKLKLKPELFYLYGHIHGRSFAKRNGIDLACDYHRFRPISDSEVKWFVNASGYWDENVFATKVK